MHNQFCAAATAQLLVLCNRNAVHDLLLWHGFLSEWEGGIRISTASSAAGATAKVAFIVQTGFLSGGRYDATAEDREDCFGRATVALSLAILCTFMVSPIDMAGLPGMAQVLACCHNDCITRIAWVLRATRRLLDWSLGQTFLPTSAKRPLAIAMPSSKEGMTRMRRYRLVVAKKA